MDVQAITKFVRIPPEKARQVARLLQGKPVAEAMTIAELVPRKAGEIFAQTLRSAVANAKNNFDLNPLGLIVKEATVGPGPIIRRFRPKARGSAGRIRKRTSHITVIVTDII